METTDIASSIGLGNTGFIYGFQISVSTCYNFAANDYIEIQGYCPDASGNVVGSGTSTNFWCNKLN